ncbi:MAG: hypothetical protein ACXADC_17855 [Candidatus Thorarchaeota archaeon]|jgi:hypothetical protein
MQWLRDDFSENYITADALATEPTVLISFTVEYVRDVDLITERLLNSGFITSVESMILYPSTRFSDHRAIKPDLLIAESGF